MTGYCRRMQRTRPQFKIMLIVCEGKSTEPRYFESFRERNSGVNIIPIHSGSTDPRSIVRYSIEKKREYQIRKGDGNEVWCVFDVDENTDSDLRDSIEHAEANGIHVALSNPSFELWYLLHFIMREAAISRQEVSDELKRCYLPGYEKSIRYSSVLRQYLPTAISNAEKLNRHHKRNGSDLHSRAGNPSTQVFILIRAIQAMIEGNRTIIT
jgi:hypothetical protein